MNRTKRRWIRWYRYDLRCSRIGATSTLKLRAMDFEGEAYMANAYVFVNRNWRSLKNRVGDHHGF